MKKITVNCRLLKGFSFSFFYEKLKFSLCFSLTPARSRLRVDSAAGEAAGDGAGDGEHRLQRPPQPRQVGDQAALNWNSHTFL